MSAASHKESQSSFDSLSATSLLDKCIRQDPGAWEEFLRRYGPLILGTVIKKLTALGRPNARSDADDIFQEVFKDLLENDCRALVSIKNRSRIESWLCAVAVHKTIDFVRKKKRYSPYCSDEDFRVAEQGVSYFPSELNEVMAEAIEQLRPDEQLLLKWYYIHDLKYKEIAGLAKIPVNTVSTRLFRIKKKLFSRLDKSEIVKYYRGD